MALISRELVIARPADQIWKAIGDPAALPGWFPGVTTAEVSGTSRVITTASGLRMPEEIITNDAARRVFRYRITAPMIRDHLGSITVSEAGPGRSLVRYVTRCEPDTLALAIGGACGNALHELRRQLEGRPGDERLVPASGQEG